jgi:formylglycine-generating enzyme required for sulfatase activity
MISSVTKCCSFFGAVFLLFGVISSALAADFDTVSDAHGEFVFIPAGTFQMGTTDAERSWLLEQKAWSQFNECELPAHQVTISKPFLMGKFEVTQRQWKQVMGNNPSAFKGEDLPVDSVSWEEVMRFLQKINHDTPAKYRLPTEAEWEYCCRADSTNAFGLGRSGETVAPVHVACYAWFRGDADNRTHPIGEKRPNAFGLYDMHGNVWEWCQDWYAPDFYSRSPKVDPCNTEPSTERCFRGGSWFLDWANLRASYRSGNLPSFKSQYVGFRLVRDP